MKIIPIPMDGAFLVEQENRVDDRGFFARAFCKHEFDAVGISFNPIQMNNSLSLKKGTLRGMHYQLPDASENKFVRCTRGSFYDVIIDLRPDSSTFLKWYGVELSDENRLAIYVPKGFAHGFLTTQDNSEALYMVDHVHDQLLERGIRYDDPLIAIKWPIEIFEVSEKDKSWPNFNNEFHGVKYFKE